MNRTRVFLAAVAISAVLIPGLASADPVSIVYEGDDFPENVGWQRFTQYGGSQRSLSDGVLTLNSLSSREIADYYQQPWLRDPQPGEIFVAELRVRVNEEKLFPENGMVIARAERHSYLEILIGYDSLVILPRFAVIPISPKSWHTLMLYSREMQSYTLFIDGAIAYTGVFETETLNQGFCAFGDGVVGASSRTEWDYARFLIVPEPSSLVGLVVLGLFAWRRTSTRHNVRALCALALSSNAAFADPVSIVYEGNDFPEFVGWQRFTAYGGAERSLNAGALTLDSTHNRDDIDYYEQPWLRDPAPGELFIAEMRVRVTEGDAFPESGMIIAAADRYGATAILVGYDRLIILPFYTEIPLAPATWYTISLRSPDMRSFDLYINGIPAHAGQFDHETLNRGFCGFGDEVGGASSRTEWDYVRFVVIPEPSAIALYLLPALMLLGVRR